MVSVNKVSFIFFQIVYFLFSFLVLLQELGFLAWYWRIVRRNILVLFLVLEGRSVSFLPLIMIFVPFSQLPQWLRGKKSACSAGAAGDAGLIPGSGRSYGGGHTNPLQYSCLENPMDRESWWATVQSTGSQSRTQLKQLSTHAFLMVKYCGSHQPHC